LPQIKHTGRYMAVLFSGTRSACAVGVELNAFECMDLLVYFLVAV